MRRGIVDAPLSCMQIRQLFDKESSTYSYLVFDGGVAALIDPVREQIERDLALVRELGLHLAYVIETHVHADHITAAGLIRERTGAKTAASAAGAPCVRRLDRTSRHMTQNVRSSRPGRTCDTIDACESCLS